MILQLQAERKRCVRLSRGGESFWKNSFSLAPGGPFFQACTYFAFCQRPPRKLLLVHFFSCYCPFSFLFNPYQSNILFLQHRLIIFQSKMSCLRRHETTHIFLSTADFFLAVFTYISAYKHTLLPLHSDILTQRSFTHAKYII